MNDDVRSDAGGAEEEKGTTGKNGENCWVNATDEVRDQQRHDYLCYGGIFGKVRGSKLLWYMPVMSIRAFLSSAIVLYDWSGNCTVALVALTGVQFIVALIVFFAMPYRVGLRNTSSIILSLVAAVIPLSGLLPARGISPLFVKRVTMGASIVSVIAGIIQILVAWKDRKWRWQERLGWERKMKIAHDEDELAPGGDTNNNMHAAQLLAVPEKNSGKEGQSDDPKAAAKKKSNSSSSPHINSPAMNGAHNQANKDDVLPSRQPHAVTRNPLRQ